MMGGGWKKKEAEVLKQRPERERFRVILNLT